MKSKVLNNGEKKTIASNILGTNSFTSIGATKDVDTLGSIGISCKHDQSKPLIDGPR
jgi:hypothetical protein